MTITLLLSCNKDSEQDWSGMEYMTFKISGKVTDGAGSPLAGISVEALGYETLTRADGTYLLEGRGGSSTSVFVNFSDKDGQENGGFYMGSSAGVQLEYVKGKHGPYLGLFSKAGVDAVLASGQMPPSSMSAPYATLK